MLEMEVVMEIISWNGFQIFSCRVLLGSSIFVRSRSALLQNDFFTWPSSTFPLGIVENLGFEKYELSRSPLSLVTEKQRSREFK